MEKLDSTDYELLELLQKGDMCKPSATRLAHKLKLPITTVHSKLKRLEKIGAIKGYPAIIDGKSVGTDFLSYAVIKVKYEQRYLKKEIMESFGEKLSKIPEILSVHICSGDWDYLIKVKAKNPDDYYRIASEKILPLGGIERLESYVAYATYKDTPAIPLFYEKEK